MGDVISRDDACSMMFSSGVEKDCVLYVPYREVMSHLRELPSAQEWIPCSERLPEIRTSVIICTKYHLVGEGYYFRNRLHVVWNMAQNNATYWDDEVVAWMPLPEAYKENKNE